MMTNEFSKLPFESVLQGDAAEIVAAREKARLMHRTKDIRASGDEVEHTVRKVLRRKFSQAYYVGHGHIVDSQWLTSPQLDVIIADNNSTPVLFEGATGSEYFPYESVYAIGEVKTAYSKHESPIHTFTEKVRTIKSTLQRDTVQALQSGGSILSSIELNERVYGSSNPLFVFMLFVEAPDFSIDDVRDLYSTSKATDLPNVVCFINEGVILFKKEGGWSTGENWSSFSIHPGFSDEMNLTLHARQSGRWYFNQFGSEENRIGANFGFLYSVISSFLGRCTLQSPNIAKYTEQIFTVTRSEEIAEDQVPPLRFG
jgi:hypothetical protein